MEQDFEYIHVVSALDTFHVNDIGNIILLANNDISLQWILYIKTDFGRTLIKEFGPLYQEKNAITKFGFDCHMEEIDYNEKKLTKSINTFLNNPRREITQVREIDLIEYAEKLNLAKDLLYKNEI